MDAKRIEDRTRMGCRDCGAHYRGNLSNRRRSADRNLVKIDG